MELHEELSAVSAIFGDEVEVIDSSSCRVKLKTFAVHVVWSTDALPKVSVSDASFEHHVHAVLSSASIGDAVIFDLLERLREAEKEAEHAAIDAKVLPIAAAAAPVAKKMQNKPKNPKRADASKNNTNNNSNTSSNNKKNADSKSEKGRFNKPQQNSAAPRKTDHVYVPGAILSAEQENRLAALLRLDEADIPSAAGGAGSIVSGSSDARTKTRLAKCYDKLEAAGLDHDTIVIGMSALLGGSYDAIVDWLLLHVPREKLPLTLGGEVKEQQQQQADIKPAKKQVEQTKKKDELRDYEFGSWTGKFPKSLMHEWAQKKGCSKPAYNRAKHKGAGLRFKVSMTVDSNKLAPEYKKGAVIEFECPEACKDEVQGQNLAATYCLFSLNKKLSLHTLLPPSYRAAWERWLDAEQEQKIESKESKEKPKREFLQTLFERICEARSDIGQAPLVALPNKNDSKPVVAATPAKQQLPKGDGGKAVRQASAVLKSWFASKKQDPRYEKMLRARSSLPIFGFRDALLQTIRSNQVTVLSGATGCGKSTQLPQFLLESMLASDMASETHIVCTQPRRISAQSIAARVSEEMAEEVGGIVGYKVRLDSCMSRKTQLLYCTTGVLLRRLQSDPLLSGTSHLVVDEVHERSLESDFLLVLLLDVMIKRPDLRLVLMSATADATLFSRYFGNAPIVDVPGRTFPIEVLYVEDLVKLTGYRIDESSEYAVEDSYEVREVDVGVTGKSGERGTERLEYETHTVSSQVAS